MATRVAILRGGVLQQIDAPLNVYRHPANKYVATFMGNPEMNFLQAEIAKSGDAWQLVGSSFRQNMPRESAESFAGRIGQKVWMGIRPEAISIREGWGGVSGLPATIDVVSPMGGNTLVYAVVDGVTIVADVPSDTEPAVGERVTLVFDPTRVHAFDMESEVTLW